MKNRKLSDPNGLAPVVVIAYVAVVGALGFFAFKPKSLDGASRNAAASNVATAAVNTAHDGEVAALKAKSSSASADMVVIGRIASTLPATPASSAITAEVAVVQSKLEAPDPVELLAAERRANAILTGNLEEARRLNALAFQDSAALRDRLAAAEVNVVKAEASRDAVDTKLGEAAAKALGAERASNMWKIGLGVTVLVYLYKRFTSVSVFALAEGVADIRKGADGITALDTVTTRTQQKLVRVIQKLFH